MNRIKNKAFNLLRWSERYTRTDMVYLAKGGWWLGIGQVVATGSAFIISIAFANLISPDAYGIYKYVISIMSLLSITTLSGMDSAVTQAVSRGFDGTLVPAVKEKIKWGYIGSVFSFFISIYYYAHGNFILGTSFLIVGIFVPFSESFDMYNSVLWGKKLFKTQTIYNNIKKIIGLVLIVLTLFLTNNILVILSVYLISTLIPNIIFFIKTKRKEMIENKIDPEALSYGKKLSMVNIMNLILTEIDKILVFQYIGAANLAIYSLATAPTDQIKGLMKNINSLALPQFSNKNIREIKETVWNKIWILFFVTTSIVFVYIIIAPFLFKIFFPRYIESIIYSQVLSLSLIPVVIAGFLYTIMESQKFELDIYKYNVYGNMFGIIILIPLIYFFGIWGAIYSRFITRTFLLFYSIHFLKNKWN